MIITLRDFKEIFISKPCDFTVTIFSGKDNIKKVYTSLSDFYDDVYCDNFVVSYFSVHHEYVKNIFVDLVSEV